MERTPRDGCSSETPTGDIPAMGEGLLSSPLREHCCVSGKAASGLQTRGSFPQNNLNTWLLLKSELVDPSESSQVKKIHTGYFNLEI